MTRPNNALSNEDYSWGPVISADQFAGALALADQIPGANIHHGTELPGTDFVGGTDTAPANYKLFSA